MAHSNGAIEEDLINLQKCKAKGNQDGTQRLATMGRHFNP